MIHEIKTVTKYSFVRYLRQNGDLYKVRRYFPKDRIDKTPIETEITYGDYNYFKYQNIFKEWRLYVDNSYVPTLIFDEDLVLFEMADNYEYHAKVEIVMTGGGITNQMQSVLFRITNRNVDNAEIYLKETICGPYSIVPTLVSRSIVDNKCYNLYKFQVRDLESNPGETTSIEATLPIYSNSQWTNKLCDITFEIRVYHESTNSTGD